MKRWVLLVLSVVIIAAGVGYWLQCVKLKEAKREVFLMDTLVQLAVYHSDAELGREALQQAVNEFERISNLTTRFPQTTTGRDAAVASDVIRINENAGIAPVTVSADVLAIVQQSQRSSVLSGGAFDTTVGPLMDLWGFGREEQRVPSDKQIAEVLPLVDYRLVEVNPEKMTVFLPKPGMSLDLGGVAKGYATEKAAQVLKNMGVKHALINAGGNIYALGTNPNGGLWRVGIRDPRNDTGLLGVLAAQDLSLVTSGDYERYFDESGVRYSHLLDPATGKQARELIQTSVAAVSSTDADIFNKPLFVLGHQQGRELEEQLPIAGAIYVTGNKEVIATGIFAEQMEFNEKSGYRLLLLQNQ